jgi:Carboxypeptidase regulatory-like domain/TonB dependent receptor-like, beta-barrel
MPRQLRISPWVIVLMLALAGVVHAQVTTATFYGIVNDPSGAVVPGAEVTLTNENTSATLKSITDVQGEFVFNFVPAGRYTLKIALAGFKSLESKNMELGAAQNVRQTFTLQVGEVTESVTVSGESPLVNTAAAEQRESYSHQQVTELPLARRNFANVLRLGTGVTTGGSGQVRLNGAGRSGTKVTLDGTSADSNPEAPGTSMYQSFNLIDVMSIEAIAEVQTTKGIVAAEYGHVLTGNVNLISRSGTNDWHGSLFENFQAEELNARVQTAATRPPLTFNQFGGSVGGPIRRDKVFIFGAYEGYRESAMEVVQGDVPTQRIRNAAIAAVPDYKLFFDTLPLPNQPHDPNGIIGRFIGTGSRTRGENHAVIKGDVRLLGNGNLAATYRRGRPTQTTPRVSPINFRGWEGEQEAVTLTFVKPFSSGWMGESRYGLNYNFINRVDGFFEIKDPKVEEKYVGGRRIPDIGGLGFGSGGGELVQYGKAPSWTFEQKFARISGKHSFKFGGIYSHRGGGRSDVENPQVAYANETEFLANIPSQVTVTFGVNPYTSSSYEFGFFLQDDWRLNPKLVLNLGIRYDYFSIFNAKPVSPENPAALYNLDGLQDAGRFIFGPLRDVDKPFEPDPMNIAPRFGFAYNPDGRGSTVIRGGFGMMFSPLIWATFNNAVGNTPTIPFRRTFSRAEAAQLGLRYPVYNEDMVSLVDRLGRISIADLFEPDYLNAPYTMNMYLGIQRALTGSMMLETAFVGNRGVKLFMYRTFNYVDRVTGVRPNTDLGFQGNYLDSSQQSFYSSWQTSLRKRYSKNLSGDIHYTWGKSLSYTGGDNAATFNDDADNSIQSFYDVKSNRGPSIGDTTHVFSADWLYDLPGLADANGLVRNILGGWQMSGIFRAQTGGPFSVTQRSPGGPSSRPDLIDPENAVLSDYRQTLLYLNRAAFARVPLSAASIPIRPGSAGHNAFRGPGSWLLDFSFGKNFAITEQLKFQLRADMFNSLNHTNLGGPTTDIDNVNFGRIFGTGGARTIQMNARLSF